jgi:hypothetical protein
VRRIRFIRLRFVGFEDLERQLLSNRVCPLPWLQVRTAFAALWTARPVDV